MWKSGILMVRKGVIKMLGILENISPLVLDVAFVSIIVLITFFGVIRGIKKVSINVLLLTISLFLGFCKYTNSLKNVIQNNILKVSNLVPAGSTNTFKFAASLLTPLLASFVIFMLLYLLMFAIKTLILMMIRRKRGAGAPKTVVGRVFGGIVSFIYGGILCVIMLIALNNNITGLNTSLEKSAVTKFVVNNSTKILDKMGNKFSSKLVIKVYNGDILYNVDDKMVVAYNYLDENIADLAYNKQYMEILDDSLSNIEGKELIKKRINDLNNLAIITGGLKKSNKEISSSFINVADEWIKAMHRSYTSNSLEKIEFGIDELSNIRLNLVKLEVSEKTLELFDEITIGN